MWHENVSFCGVSQVVLSLISAGGDVGTGS